MLLRVCIFFGLLGIGALVGATYLREFRPTVPEEFNIVQDDWTCVWGPGGEGILQGLAFDTVPDSHRAFKTPNPI